MPSAIHVCGASSSTLKIVDSGKQQILLTIQLPAWTPFPFQNQQQQQQKTTSEQKIVWGNHFSEQQIYFFFFFN